MFDFEYLHVYQKAKQFCKRTHLLLKDLKVDYHFRDQLKRASLSTMLNIAEGSGRFSMADKKRFYIISRGSIYECVALFEIFYEEGYINEVEFREFYNKSEEISKMLLRLIQSQLPVNS